ncbi:MAG: hypothetical protein QF729_04235 [Candidatus Woesearchaeota archaeon]|nr:hypothetical protein [Candidatus Woesearchaeota archaeon]
MDRNPALQRELFKQFKGNPHVARRDVAYLFDRTLSNSGQPIWFGTQNYEPADVFAIQCINGAQVVNILRDQNGNEYGELTEDSIRMVSKRLHAYGLPPIDKQYQNTVKKNKIRLKTGRAIMFLRTVNHLNQ